MGCAVTLEESHFNDIIDFTDDILGGVDNQFAVKGDGTLWKANGSEPFQNVVLLNSLSEKIKIAGMYSVPKWPILFFRDLEGNVYYFDATASTNTSNVTEATLPNGDTIKQLVATSKSLCAFSTTNKLYKWNRTSSSFELMKNFGNLAPNALVGAIDSTGGIQIFDPATSELHVVFYDVDSKQYREKVIPIKFDGTTRATDIVKMKVFFDINTRLVTLAGQDSYGNAISSERTPCNGFSELIPYLQTFRVISPAPVKDLAFSKHGALVFITANDLLLAADRKNAYAVMTANPGDKFTNLSADGLSLFSQKAQYNIEGIVNPETSQQKKR